MEILLEVKSIYSKLSNLWKFSAKHYTVLSLIYNQNKSSFLIAEILKLAKNYCIPSFVNLLPPKHK